MDDYGWINLLKIILTITIIDDYLRLFRSCPIAPHYSRAFPDCSGSFRICSRLLPITPEYSRLVTIVLDFWLLVCCGVLGFWAGPFGLMNVFRYRMLSNKCRWISVSLCCILFIISISNMHIYLHDICLL